MSLGWNNPLKKYRVPAAASGPSLDFLVLFLILAAAVVTVYLVITDARSFLAGGRLRPHHHLRAVLSGNPYDTPNVDSISDWMTFEYLNRVFGLPQDYLKGALGISDTRYPRMSIRRYALSNGLAVPDAVERVKSAVKNRLPTVPPKP